jgi:hypothetical protein
MTPGVNSVEAALWSGVSMDPFTPQWSADNIWLAGTRVRPMEDLAAALAARPPYVVMQMFPGAPTPDEGVYELIVDRPGVRLYREKSLAPTP